MANVDEFHYAILEKLSESVGSGSFKEVVKLPSGEETTFSCSLATGMGSLSRQQRYETQFQLPVPEWVRYEHPYHRGLLYELSVRWNLKLPDIKPVEQAVRKSAKTICEDAAAEILKTPTLKPYEESTRKRLISLIPQLLVSVDFRRALEANLGDRSSKIISDIVSGKGIEEDDGDLLLDATYDAFLNNAHKVLSLGWDGDFPGTSGAAWISQLEGVFIVTSSDYEDQGPFDSLDQALKCECFGTNTANAELDSKVLSLEQLLEIANRVVDWENEGDIWINSKRYVAQGSKLVEEKTE